MLSEDQWRNSEPNAAECATLCGSLGFQKGKNGPKALERSLFSVQKRLHFSMNSALCIFLPPFSGVLALAINSSALPFPSDKVVDTYSVLVMSNFTSPGFGDGCSQVASDGWLQRKKEHALEWNALRKYLRILRTNNNTKYQCKT